MVSDSKTDGFLPKQSNEHGTEYWSTDMNDSSSTTIRVIVGSDTERNSTTTGHWYNAGSRFRGTRTMPLRIEVVSVRVREHPHEERTPSEVVSWTAAGIVRRNERMKEFEGGRRPTNGRSGTMGEMSRQIPQQSELIRRTKCSISSVGKEKMIIPLKSSILSRRSPF